MKYDSIKKCKNISNNILKKNNILSLKLSSELTQELFKAYNLGYLTAEKELLEILENKQLLKKYITVSSISEIKEIITILYNKIDSLKLEEDEKENDNI